MPFANRVYNPAPQEKKRYEEGAFDRCPGGRRAGGAGCEHACGGRRDAARGARVSRLLGVLVPRTGGAPLLTAGLAARSAVPYNKTHARRDLNGGEIGFDGGAGSRDACRAPLTR